MTETAAARKGGIDEEALARLRSQLGVETPLRQYNKYADEDVIAHYAMGSGDDNPRWLDSDYAKTTKWGGIIAPSTFVLTCGFPRSRGLAGVHGLFTGVDIHCHHPIHAGTRVTATTALYALEEKIGDFAGRQFRQTYETKYRDADGRVALLYPAEEDRIVLKIRIVERHIHHLVLFLFHARQQIRPVIGDGSSLRIVHRHPAIDGMGQEGSDMRYIGGVHRSPSCSIHDQVEHFPLPERDGGRVCILRVRQHPGELLVAGYHGRNHYTQGQIT